MLTQQVAQLELNDYIEQQANLIAPEGEEDERGSGRLLCTHPNVYKFPKMPAYRAVAQISDSRGNTKTADVVVINPCLAAIDKCLDAVLGSGWHTVSFKWADTPF